MQKGCTMYTSHFVWDETKNIKLKKERGINFEAIVDLIELGNFKVLENQSSVHDGQLILVIKNYPNPYIVPFREEPNGEILLITIFQSRKYRKLFSEELK
jgi:uncharacterized DUF497 family protein